MMRCHRHDARHDGHDRSTKDGFLQPRYETTTKTIVRHTSVMTGMTDVLTIISKDGRTDGYLTLFSKFD